MNLSAETCKPTHFKSLYLQGRWPYPYLSDGKLSFIYIISYKYFDFKNKLDAIFLPLLRQMVNDDWTMMSLLKDDETRRNHGIWAMHLLCRVWLVRLFSTVSFPMPFQITRWCFWKMTKQEGIMVSEQWAMHLLLGLTHFKLCPAFSQLTQLLNSVFFVADNSLNLFLFF